MRAKVGLIAVALLTLALLLTRQTSSAGHETWVGALVRIGLVMAAVWLALPQLRNVPPRVLVLVGAVLLVLARWPRYFLLVLLLGVAVAFLRPRVAAGPRT
jgi:hypothetical protein